MIALLRRVASTALAALLIAYEALSALFGPLVRPVVAWLGALALFERIGRAIAALPPYGVLALLAVPFAIFEPLKVFALYWIAQGHVATGALMLALAHLGSLLVCERMFHAGKAKLLRIGWFAQGYRFLTRLRDAALARLRATPAWRAAAAFAAAVRARVARFRNV